MPILLYVPRARGGPFQDDTLRMSGVTNVVLTEKLGAPYIPPVFDGRLILCTHGLRQRPVIMSERGLWLTAPEFLKKYQAHFQYLKGHIKRIDLFVCHTGYSGFAGEFAEQLRYLMSGSQILINAPTAQFTLVERERKWRIGMGGVLPYVIGLSRLLVHGSFDRYASPYGMMAWAGYPRLRSRSALGGVWTALCRTRATRTTFQGSQWCGFGFKQFLVTPLGPLASSRESASS